MPEAKNFTTFDELAAALARPEGGRLVVRLEAIERRRAAIHEAGHFVLAKYIGLTGSYCRIWKSSSKEVEKTSWLGSLYFRAKDFSGLNTKHQKMFLVAGMVAELCWDRRFTDSKHSEIYWDDELTYSESLSPTDWAGLGCGPTTWKAPELSACLSVEKLFAYRTGRLWRPLLSVSRQLILNASLLSAGKEENWDSVEAVHLRPIKRRRAAAS